MCRLAPFDVPYGERCPGVVVNIRWIIGVLFLVTFVLPPAQAEERACWYYSVGEEGMHFSEVCGQLDQVAGVSLAPAVIDDAYFNDDGFACIRFSPGSVRRPLASSRDEAYLVDRKGRSAHVPIVDVDQCAGFQRNGVLVLDLSSPYEDSKAITDFRNANNRCSPPPIDSQSAALCHASRHAMHEYWTGQSAERLEASWRINYSIVDRGRVRSYAMEIGTEAADVRWHGIDGLVGR